MGCINCFNLFDEQNSNMCYLDYFATNILLYVLEKLVHIFIKKACTSMITMVFFK